MPWLLKTEQPNTYDSDIARMVNEAIDGVERNFRGNEPVAERSGSAGYRARKGASDRQWDRTDIEVAMRARMHAIAGDPRLVLAPRRLTQR